MNKPKVYRIESFIIDIWIALLVLTLILSVLIYFFNTTLARERKALSKEEASISQGIQLKEYSDYLTSQVRLFVMTAEPKYIIAYWTEITLDKHRDKVIARLNDLNVSENEKKLLLQAKKNSDGLVKTEATAMKLVLVAMGVPSDQMPPAAREDTLSSAEIALSAMEKVNLAQRMMFDQEYLDKKNKIMTPINQFQALMQQRLTDEIANARQRVNNVFNGIVFILLLIVGLLISMIWMKNALSLKKEPKK